jgi:hypothetical protein
MLSSLLKEWGFLEIYAHDHYYSHKLCCNLECSSKNWHVFAKHILEGLQRELKKQGKCPTDRFCSPVKKQKRSTPVEFFDCRQGKYLIDRFCSTERQKRLCLRLWLRRDRSGFGKTGRSVGRCVDRAIGKY